MIKVTCRCGAALQAPDDAAGKRVRCLKCKQPVDVPVAVGISTVGQDNGPVSLGLDLGEDAVPDNSPLPPGFMRPAKGSSRYSDDDDDELPRSPWFYSALEALGYGAIVICALALLLIALAVMIGGEGPAMISAIYSVPYLLIIFVCGLLVELAVDAAKNVRRQRHAAEQAARKLSQRP